MSCNKKLPSAKPIITWYVLWTSQESILGHTNIFLRVVTKCENNIGIQKREHNLQYNILGRRVDGMIVSWTKVVIICKIKVKPAYKSCDPLWIRVLSLVENLFVKKNPLQDLLSSLNAVISTNDRHWIITGHVIFKLCYNQSTNWKPPIFVILNWSNSTLSNLSQ